MKITNQQCDCEEGEELFNYNIKEEVPLGLTWPKNIYFLVRYIDLESPLISDGVAFLNKRMAMKYIKKSKINLKKSPIGEGYELFKIKLLEEST